MEITHFYQMLFFTSLTLNIYSQEAAAQGFCDFPDFLWSTTQDGKPRTWIARTSYDKLTHNITSYKEITVGRSVIEINQVDNVYCHNEETNTTGICVKPILIERLICISQEAGEKFRVQVKENRDPFSCLQFKRKNDNIIQLWQAKYSRDNVAQLCFDEYLIRDPWPWIASIKQSWSYPAFTGGFNFRAYDDRERKICKHQWRPSRIESECIKGEGITFSFPDFRCSIFPRNPEEVRLYSWGSWEEERQIFTLLGEPGLLPRYTLVLAAEVDSQMETKADLYLQPIAPLSHADSRALTYPIHHLDVTRSESGVCYDESEDCAMYSQEGKCTSESWHKYANHCKKSCGLCEFVPSVVTECAFPKSYMGRWMMVEDDSIEDLNVTSGRLDFSSLGSFICKSKHWERDIYKMFSIYDNGCRPRYSFMQFRRSDEALLLRISKSDRADKSFEFCEFQDDPLPKKKKVPTEDYKIYLPLDRTLVGSCGLGGKQEITATYRDGVTCDGQVTDWDMRSCSPGSELTFTVYSCSKDHWRVYNCVAFVNMGHNKGVMITRNTDSAFGLVHNQCWIVYHYGKREESQPWRSAYLTSSAQCGQDKDFEKAYNDQMTQLALQTKTDIITKECRVDPYETKYWPVTAYPKNDHTPNNNRHGRTSQQSKGIKTGAVVANHGITVMGSLGRTMRGWMVCCLVMFPLVWHR